MNKTLGECLILFAKLPKADQVKTRLAAEIGRLHAVEFYKSCLRDMKKLMSKIDGEKIISYSPDTKEARDYFQRLAAGLTLTPQRGADLGERMCQAFVDCFSHGFERVVLIGSDTPQLSSDTVQQAFKLLHSQDCVIGPANDGGYYLVGFRKSGFTKAVFEYMPWSTERVLNESLARLAAEKKSTRLMPVLCDVDTLVDLADFFRAAPSYLETAKYVTHHNLLKEA